MNTEPPEYEPRDSEDLRRRRRSRLAVMLLGVVAGMIPAAIFWFVYLTWLR